MLGILAALVPIIYQRYLINYDYVYVFYVSQTAYVFVESLNLFAATRYNLYLGIPDPLMYFLGGTVGEIFEGTFTFFAS